MVLRDGVGLTVLAGDVLAGDACPESVFSFAFCAQLPETSVCPGGTAAGQRLDTHPLGNLTSSAGQRSSRAGERRALEPTRMGFPGDVMTFRSRDFVVAEPHPELAAHSARHRAGETCDALPDDGGPELEDGGAAGVEGRARGDASLQTITLDEKQRLQTMDGFGFALTGGSAELLMKMDPPARAAILQTLLRAWCERYRGECSAGDDWSLRHERARVHL